jgi:ribosome-binding ATPase YchF (GTP1/OBG family)
LEGASERFRKRQESQVAREARKKEKQDNKQARQDKVFDLKKADAERADKEFQFKKDEAERAHELQKLQFKVNKEMLLFLRSRPPPNPDQNGGDKLV